MELKDRKYIKNTRTLPKFYNGVVGNTFSVYSSNNDYMNYLNENYGLNRMQNILSLTPSQIRNNSGIDTSSRLQTPNNLNLNVDTDLYKNEEKKSDSAALGLGPWFALGSWIGGGIAEGLNSIKSSDELMSSTTQSSGSIGGIGYTTSSNLDKDKIMSDYNRSTAMDFLTNPFRGITKLFGKSKQEKEIKKALEKIAILNETNRSSAVSSYMQQENAQKYGRTMSQTLFSYKQGKNAVDPTTGETINNYVVETANGKEYGKQNSWVSKGEGIWNPITGYTNYITHGENDTARAYLEDSDVVFGNKKNPITGNKFKEDAAPLILEKQQTGNPQIDELLGQLAYLLQEEMENKRNGKKSLPGFKCGKKLKKCDSGITPWGNIFSSAATGLAGLSQYLQAKNDVPYLPNTYVANPYLNKGLNTLAELNISEYPIIQQMRAAEARANYAINASGGLSTALKHLSRVASLNNTQLNIAKLLSDAQQQNNAYKTQYANAALQYGDREAANKMSAMRHDLDYYSKSHAARQQQMQMGIYNMINALLSYYSNDFKRNLFNETMDLYRDNNKLEWEKLNAALNNMPAKNNNTTPSSTVTSSAYYNNLSNPYTNNQFWKYLPNYKLKVNWK